MAKVPKFVNQQDISKRIVHAAAWLTWVVLLASNQRILGWVARRYAGITDLNRVDKWPRRAAFLIAYVGTISLFIGIGSFFADYYIGLLCLPLAALLYGISLWLLIKYYQGPLLARPHPFGKIGKVFAYLYGVLERLIEVIRHGTP